MPYNNRKEPPDFNREPEQVECVDCHGVFDERDCVEVNFSLDGNKGLCYDCDVTRKILGKDDE